MWIVVLEAYADCNAVVRVARATDKTLIHAFLRLLSEVVVNACNNNNEFVSSVSRLSDQSNIVGGLPGLDMAYDQSTPVPRSFACRIL